MKKQNRGLCCSRLEDPPRFGCSDKIYKHKKKFKKKRFFKTNKKYYKRNKYKKRFYKKNKFKTNPPKKCKCWLYNEEGHYANECPKKKKANIKIFEDFNDLELITDSEDISENDSIYYLSGETLRSSDSE